MISEALNPLYYSFADFRVDVEKRRLWCGEELVSVTPKVFDTLLVLLEHPGEVLEKERLMELLWPDSFVEESNLAQNIAVLRKALGEDRKQHKFIITIPGRGYRFVGDPVTVSEPELMGKKSGSESGQGESPSAPDKTSGDSSRTSGRHIRRAALFAGIVLIPATAVLSVVWLWGRKIDQPPTITRTTQLTTWSGLDFYPTISPNGNLIAFSSDRTGSFEIYVKQISPVANEVQLTSDEQQNIEPAFSPDGSRIAYHSNRRGGVWLVSVSGGTPRQLSDFGSHPSWSPDGSHVAFQSASFREVGFNAANAQPPSTIWVVPSAGGTAVQITEVGKPVGGHGAPTWSPDGTRIAFDSSDYGNYSVWSIPSGGGEPRPISKGMNATDAVFEPDGKAIYFVTSSGSAVQRQRISPNGDPVGESEKLLDASASRIRQLSISAEGKRLVYSAISTSGDIWAVDTNAGRSGSTAKPVQLTQGKGMRNTTPAYSPDGKKIVYSSFKVGSGFQTWVMDADGGHRLPLADNGSRPHWFPDDRRVFYSVHSSNSTEFYSVVAEGGMKQKILVLDGDVVAESLSPLGDQIAFHSSRSGVRNVWVVPISGGEPKQITFNSDPTGFPAWSRDGKFLSVQLSRGDSSTIGVIPFTGGQAVELPINGLQNDWSPDGDRLLIARAVDNVWNVYSVSKTTLKVDQLTHFTKLSSYVLYPVWSPLGDKIAFEYAETTGNIWSIDLK